MCDMQGMSGLDLDLSYRPAFTYMMIINQAAAKPHSPHMRCEQNKQFC